VCNRNQINQIKVTSSSKVLLAYISVAKIKVAKSQRLKLRIATIATITNNNNNKNNNNNNNNKQQQQQQQ
jgi:hypothetical protein